MSKIPCETNASRHSGFLLERGSDGRIFLLKSLQQKLAKFAGAAFPGVLTRRFGCFFAQALTQRSVFVKARNQFCEFLGLFRVFENVTVYPVGYDLADPRLTTHDRGDSTGHCFKRRERKSVFERRAHVDIGGSVINLRVGMYWEKLYRRR